MNPDLPEQILNDMSYAELAAQCNRIIHFSDDEIKEKIDPEQKSTPDEIRKKYQYILDNVKEADFTDLKFLHSSKKLIAEADSLSTEHKFEQALEKYHRALVDIQRITQQQISMPLFEYCYINSAQSYIQLKLYDNAISECLSVFF